MNLRAKSLLWLSGTRLWRSCFLVRLHSSGAGNGRFEATVTIKPWAKWFVFLVALVLGDRRGTA